MGTYLILFVLIVCVILAFLSSSQHFKGQGGCCGGGDVPKRVKPKKLKNLIGKKIIHIEGMTCQNCQTRVANALNEHEHLSAEVNLNKKIAVVSYNDYIDDVQLTSIVENCGYQVVRIETK